MDIDRLLKLANKKTCHHEYSDAREVGRRYIKKISKNLPRAIAGLKNIDRILTKKFTNSETLNEAIDQLVTLHGQKKFELLLQRSLKLRTQFPESILLYNFCAPLL